MSSVSKTKASKLGTARGGFVSKYEHELLWEVVRKANDSIAGMQYGHNLLQDLQDALDTLEDEFADPKDI